MIPATFFKDVEKRLKYILYSDTDSLFIHIPIKFNYDDPEKSMKIVNDVAESINNKIIDHLNSYVLPKLGIDPKYNETFFKTEIIADSIFFLGVKKNYAFRLLVKEGNIINSKPIEYTGLTSKSDITKYTKEIINHVIENIMFDIELSDTQKRDKTTQFIKGYYDKILADINELKIHSIGQPKKWSVKLKNDKDTWQIIGMRLYNTLFQEEHFKPMSGGILIPIIIDNPTEFLKKLQLIDNSKEYYLKSTPINNITWFAFPYTFDADKVKQLFKEYCIKIDVNKIWGKIYNKTLQDIVSLFNQYCNPYLQNRIMEIK